MQQPVSPETSKTRLCIQLHTPTAQERGFHRFALRARESTLHTFALGSRPTAFVHASEALRSEACVCAWGNVFQPPARRPDLTGSRRLLSRRWLGRYVPPSYESPTGGGEVLKDSALDDWSRLSTAFTTASPPVVSPLLSCRRGGHLGHLSRTHSRLPVTSPSTPRRRGSSVPPVRTRRTITQQLPPLLGSGGASRACIISPYGRWCVSMLLGVFGAGEGRRGGGTDAVSRVGESIRNRARDFHT